MIAAATTTTTISQSLAWPRLAVDAAEHGGGLARDHEPDEQRVLGEDEQTDEDVHEHAGYAQDVVDQAAHAALPRRSE